MTRLRPLMLMSTAAALQLGAAILCGGASARGAPLTPEQIAGFNAKLAQAHATQKTVGDREVCLDAYRADLQNRGQERERNLGDVLRREAELAADLNRLDDEQRQFSAAFSDEQRNLGDKERDWQSAVAEQREQDRRLRECKQALTILSFLCDVGDQAVRELGWMRNVQAEMGGIQARLGHAQNALNDAQRRLGESQNALAQTRDRAASDRASIAQIEGEITRVKSTISDLHTTLQVYNALFEDFASMFDDAGSIDAESPRARQVTRLSSEVDDLIMRAPAVIDLADSAMPEGVRQNCSPH